jgi:hypothetical protein
MIRTRALHASSNSGSCAETRTEQLLLILLLVLHCCDGSGMGLRGQSVLLLDEGTPLPKSLGLRRAHVPTGSASHGSKGCYNKNEVVFVFIIAPLDGSASLAHIVHCPAPQASMLEYPEEDDSQQ